MKYVGLLIIIISNSCFSFSHQHFNELGMDPQQQNDVAMYTFLYELALKNQLSDGKFLGPQTCIDVAKKDNGELSLAIGMKDAAFKTGSYEFDENAASYKNMTELTNVFRDFFASAKNEINGTRGYKPRVTVESYSDPQHNQLSNLSTSDPVLKNVKSEYVRTTSQKRNYVLAHKRGEAYAKKFLPNENVEVKAYHSPDIDRLTKRPGNNSAFSCENRRGVVVRFDVDPARDLSNQYGAYTPGFNVAKGKEHRAQLLAASMDAGRYESYEDLPKHCQHRTIRKTYEKSRAIFTSTKKLIDESKSYITTIMVPKLKTFCAEHSYHPICEDKKYEKLSSKDKLATDKAVYDVLEYFREENFNPVFAPNSQGGRLLRQFRQKAHCAAFDRENCRDRDHPGKNYNSSHFTDCFSAKFFYEDNISKYTYRPSNINPETSEVTISYNSSNIPRVNLEVESKVSGKGNVKKYQGYGCNVCGHGLHLEKNRLKYYHRADRKSDHANPVLSRDSHAVHDHFQNNSSVETMFHLGQNKSPKVYILKNCDMKNFAQSKMVDLSKSQTSGSFSIEKDVKLGAGDCIFKPDIISSCNHAPSGKKETSEGVSGKNFSIYSFLLGKRMDKFLENSQEYSQDIFTNQIFNELKPFCGEELAKVPPKEKMINNILCSKPGKPNKGISLPTPGFDSKGDCPEIGSRQ